MEICQFGEWKTVCDNNWSENEARVACRQLGYSDQGEYSMIISYIDVELSLVQSVQCTCLVYVLVAMVKSF